MPSCLGNRLPNFEGPRAARGAMLLGSSLRHTSGTHRRHLFLFSRGLCPLPSHCPLLPPIPGKKRKKRKKKNLDCGALDTLARFVPVFPGLSLCTSGRGPYLVFTHTSFVFPLSLIQGGSLE